MSLWCYVTNTETEECLITSCDIADIYPNFGIDTDDSYISNGIPADSSTDKKIPPDSFTVKQHYDSLTFGIPKRFQQLASITKSVEDVGYCPEAYPYAFMFGVQCCASPWEDVWEDLYAATCNGGPLGFDSLCCLGEDVECDNLAGMCADNSLAFNVVEPTTNYYDWKNWERGWVPDKK